MQGYRQRSEWVGRDNRVCGGLAGAVNYEVITGKPVSPGTMHSQKGNAALKTYKAYLRSINRSYCLPDRYKKKDNRFVGGK